MKDLPLGRIAALVLEFTVKDLPLGRTLIMMIAPKPMKLAFEFALQAAVVQCHESNMAFSQQLHILDKETFENGCFN